MQERTAKVEQEYAGRQHRVGDRFDVDDQDVPVLLHAGLVEPEKGDKTPGYMTRDLQAGRRFHRPKAA